MRRISFSHVRSEAPMENKFLMHIYTYYIAMTSDGIAEPGRYSKQQRQFLKIYT